mmetsp:Transcript_30556/g.75195  ORF Transcript_30556/g.75195 Transcript_30556/m.75195 type:complete len:99 (-) Transcript_30556:366-662(-)|eukprot:3654774-Prymnesium_polylepis.2
MVCSLVPPTTSMQCHAISCVPLTVLIMFMLPAADAKSAIVRPCVRTAVRVQRKECRAVCPSESRRTVVDVRERVAHALLEFLRVRYSKARTPRVRNVH